MTNEEVQEIIDRAEDEHDRLKDRVHEQYDEIKRLNNIINKAIEYLTKCNYNDLKFTSRIYDILLNILKGVDKE